jgi:mRNA-degrading endonuclease RelE of RelBE toxin-antitoxin system
MSLTPAFAADAKSQWRALAAEHQEIVLDLLDELAVNPPPDGESVASDVLEEHGLRHHIFVHVLVERDTNTLTILGVGHASRPLAE